MENRMPEDIQEVSCLSSQHLALLQLLWTWPHHLFALEPHKLLCRKAPRAKFWRNFSPTWAKNAAKKMAKFFADFRPSISRKSGRKKFHEKLATNSAGREIKFFHRETLGGWGHKNYHCAQKYYRSDIYFSDLISTKPDRKVNYPLTPNYCLRKIILK